MSSLLDHFSPVISEGLGLAASMSSAKAPLDDAAAIRTRLVAGLRQAQTRARRAVYAEEDLQLASQGVIAWLDEVMRDDRGWGAATPSLDAEFSGGQIDRRSFFDHLETLGDDQDEVREIYYLLLCLGFEGRYRDLPDGGETLERLKDLHGQRLQTVPASAASLAGEQLNPQPYSVKPPSSSLAPRMRQPRQRPPTKPAAGATAGSARSNRQQASTRHTFSPDFLKGETEPSKSWHRGLLGGSLEGVQPPSLPGSMGRLLRPGRSGLIIGLVLVPVLLLVVAGYLLLPWWLRQEVNERITAYECARLEARVSGDRVVTLSGYVSSDRDRKELLSGLVQTFGIAGIKEDIAVYPWPFCEALEIVKPFFDQNVSGGLNLALGVTAANNVLKEGDPLVLTITSPTYPAYLYVDYFQQNGDVGHVAHADPNDIPDAADDAFEFPTGYEGSPPYGLELLTIFASPTPLFEAPLPTFEKASTYLPALRKRLGELAKSNDKSSLAASLVFVRTVP